MKKVWLNFSAWQGAALRPLRRLVQAVPPEWEMRVLQGPLRGTKWVAGASNAGCWLGSYEVEVQALISQIVKPGQVFYDIGANVGFFTLLASRLVGPGGRVYAFEPMPDNLARLRQHLALNRVANVEVIAAAVSHEAGELTFSGAEAKAHRADIRIGISKLREYVGRHDVPRNPHDKPGYETKVRAVALDDLYQAGEIKPPDILKMDIEGAELDAFRGMTKLLRETRPLLLIEFHGALIEGQDADTLSRKLLTEFGYDLEVLNCGETYGRPRPMAS